MTDSVEKEIANLEFYGDWRLYKLAAQSTFRDYKGNSMQGGNIFHNCVAWGNDSSEGFLIGKITSHD